MNENLKAQIQTYSRQQLHNVLSITTKAIRMLLEQKTKNRKFWQLVGAREMVIGELSKR